MSKSSGENRVKRFNITMRMLPVVSAGAVLVALAGYLAVQPAEPKEHPTSPSISAKILAGGSTHVLRSNRSGWLRRVYVKGQETIPVEVNYPEAREGERVLVSVEDGGRLDNGRLAKLVTLGADRSAGFRFETGDHPGLYRVSLSKGPETRLLQFWVGDPPPVSQRALRRKTP